MQSQYGPTSAGKGHENRRPWVPKGAPQVKFRPPGGPPGASWAPSRPQKGALGGKEEFENCMEGHLGVLLARLGPILGRIPPPLGVPGEAPGGHIWTFLGRPSRVLKNNLFF